MEGDLLLLLLLSLTRNLRGLLGIRKMDRVPNAWIRELGGLKKGSR